MGAKARGTSGGRALLPPTANLVGKIQAVKWVLTLPCSFLECPA